jgi:hypothetical protein
MADGECWEKSFALKHSAIHAGRSAVFAAGRSNLQLQQWTVPRAHDLRRVLADRLLLLGDRLSLADIPAGTSLYRYFNIDIARPHVPHVERWYRALREREALPRACHGPVRRTLWTAGVLKRRGQPADQLGTSLVAIEKSLAGGMSEDEPARLSARRADARASLGRPRAACAQMRVGPHLRSTKPTVDRERCPVGTWSVSTPGKFRRVSSCAPRRRCRREHWPSEPAS